VLGNGYGMLGETPFTYVKLKQLTISTYLMQIYGK